MDGEGIGWAVKQLCDGGSVCRSGWNGKGMFLTLIPQRVERALRRLRLEEIVFNPYIVITGPDGKVTPWNASQQDLLARDWELVGPDLKEAA